MTLLDHPPQPDERHEVVDASPPPARPTIDRAAPTVNVSADAGQLESSDRAVLASFVKGSIIGAIVVFLVCGGITVAAGFGWGPAVGVGAFAAFWGGPGFGGMMGAVLGHSHASG